MSSCYQYRYKIPDNAHIFLTVDLNTWHLPFLFGWTSMGKGLMKGVFVGFLCFCVEYNNGKPPF